MGQFDISMKHILAAYPRDWARYFGVPESTELRVIDTDLSAVTTIADKVFEILGEPRFLMHLEPQANYDSEIDVRVFEANARLSKQQGCPVHSCVLVLDKRAWGKENRGYYRVKSPLGGCHIEFTYQVLKVWEMPPEKLMACGLGLLPLVPLSAATKAELPSLMKKMAKRVRKEASAANAAELWGMTFFLVGLRFDREFATHLLRGVIDMLENSSTYQAIAEKKLAEGKVEGVIEGRRDDLLELGTRRFGKPSAKVKATLAQIQDAKQLSAMVGRILDVSNWQELLEDK